MGTARDSAWPTLLAGETQERDGVVPLRKKRFDGATTQFDHMLVIWFSSRREVGVIIRVVPRLVAIPRRADEPRVLLAAAAAPPSLARVAPPAHAAEQEDAD